MNCIDNDKLYVANSYNRFNVVLTNGNNATAIDQNNKSYIDFGSGIGVNSLGYCNQKWADAISNQAHTLQHTSNLYYTQPQVLLAEKLCNNTFAKKVFFCNSGAEAVETTIKVARKYSYDKYGEGRNKIVTLINSFHGRTMTALSATGQEVFHQYFFPFDTSFDYAQAGDINSLMEKIDDTTCAVIIELIQGEGGVIPLNKDYVDKLVEICHQKDILLAVDEVQTGIGRTGKLLASQYYGITPDLTSLAKGLGGGLPIGACLMGEKVANVLGYGHHGSTFGGNPVVCAGSLVVLEELIDNNLLHSIKEKSAYIKTRLRGCPQVKHISGLGLMLGITLTTKTAKDVASQCLENGLLVLTAKEKIRLLPPLNISHKELEDGMNILISVLKGE